MRTNRYNMGGLALMAGMILLGSRDAAASNLILNSNFSAGNTGFTSSYTFVAAPGGGPIGAGTYAIGTNPNAYHSGFASFGAPGGVNMMIVNGSSTVNTSLWGQSIVVTPNTDYFFSTMVATAVAVSPALLQFSINGSQTGPIFTAPATTGDWQQFYTTWNSGSNSTATLSILNQNTTLGGNDFAITNLTFDTTNPGGTDVSGVPEPSTGALLGSVLAAFFAGRRLRRGRTA